MGAEEERGYRPIRDYALIGDAHTAALVATDGSIDWCCWLHFDSPAVFCRLLDARKGGWFQIGPAAEQYEVTRRYAGPTAVLETTFDTAGGRFRITDFMPVERLTESHRGGDIGSSRSILRLVECLGGSPGVAQVPCGRFTGRLEGDRWRRAATQADARVLARVVDGLPL
jgi:alpha,alpha-trehalase